MDLNRVPRIVADFAASRRTADERRRLMKVALKASELVVSVTSEQAKREANAERASGPGRAGL